MEVVHQAVCLGWIGVRTGERAPAAGLGRLCRIIQDAMRAWRSDTQQIPLVSWVELFRTRSRSTLIESTRNRDRQLHEPQQGP